jgi:hypothetical protein
VDLEAIAGGNGSARRVVSMKQGFSADRRSSVAQGAENFDELKRQDGSIRERNTPSRISLENGMIES